jgi:hypothetical protein
MFCGTDEWKLFMAKHGVLILKAIGKPNNVTLLWFLLLRPAIDRHKQANIHTFKHLRV